MADMIRSDRCANPFRKTGEKGHIGKSLRKVPTIMLQKFPFLSEYSRICSNCMKLWRTELNNADMPAYKSIAESENGDISLEINGDNADEFSGYENNIGSTRDIELEEMLDGLKQKFASLKNGDPLKLQILTIAPSSWSARKIAAEFGTSRHLAQKSKDLKSSYGVLADTTAKKGKELSQQTVQKVIEFYTDDENSRQMSGMKDCISMIINGERTSVQKRLLLMNLKELFTSFITSNPEYNISFSTFAKLRPKNCILPGGSGTHSVCVCTIHQNVKLLLDAINITKLTENTDKPLTSYHDCLKELVCAEPRPDCYIDECDNCPGITELMMKLRDALDLAFISHVQCSFWSGTDRSTLLTQTLPIDDYLNELSSKLLVLKPHSYIAKQQALFIKDKRQNLLDGEIVVMFDFSENYAYVCQDASQAFHFNNNQCTVFPVIYYYKQNNELQHKSIVFLSESLKHDTAAVYAVQTLLMPIIKEDVKNPKKIIYMTDGAKQHFKNKYQISNLIHHKTDFNIVAEWHYSPTAHGKSAYDGIGATFKREAYRASLTAKPQDAILSLPVLYQWAKSNFKGIRVVCFEKTYHEKMRRKLNKRFADAQPVPQILRNHGFLVVSDNKVVIKRYSNDKAGKNVWCPYKKK